MRQPLFDSVSVRQAHTDVEVETQESELLELEIRVRDLTFVQINQRIRDLSTCNN